MKKRFMSCLLATAMVITSLTACGGGKSTTTDTTAAAGGDAKETTAGEAAGDTPSLDKFGRDLTAAAKNGELDPVIGRKQEIERIILF